MAALVALAAAACGSDSERPALPVAISTGGASAEAAGTAADSAIGGSAAEMRMSIVDYKLDADTSGLPEEGPAYEVKSDVSEGDVRDLAEALGIEGEPKKGERGEWTVSDGAGALLTVEPMSGSPWYFQATGACGPEASVSSDGAMSCSGGGVSTGGAGVSEPSKGETAVAEEPASEPADQPTEPGEQPVDRPVEEAPAPVEPVRPENMPTKAEAETTARALFETLGVDLEGGAFHIEDGFSAWYVAVEPLVDGLPTLGFGWSASIGPDNKIESASGHLGDATKVADYPLVEVEEAVEKMQSQFRAMTDIAVDCSDTPEGEGAATQALCAEPAEPQVVRITDVRLGLLWSPSYTSEGPGYLTPAWFLSMEGAGEMPVNALPDEYVQQPEVEGEPEPAPLPADGGGVDGREPAQTEPAPAPAEE